MILVKEIDAENAETVCNSMANFAVMVCAVDEVPSRGTIAKGEVGLVVCDFMEEWEIKFQGGGYSGRYGSFMELVKKEISKGVYRFFYIEIMLK